jgi:hypothetical protein
MAITTAMATTFRQELASMTPHTAADTYKLVLIADGHSGTYGAGTTNVGTPGSSAPSSSNLGTDAVPTSGSYDVDGITLAGFAVTVDAGVAIISFTAPTTLDPVDIAADGCLIYNSTRGGRVLGVYAFADAPRIATGGPFAFTFPAAAAATGLLRI